MTLKTTASTHLPLLLTIVSALLFLGAYSPAGAQQISNLPDPALTPGATRTTNAAEVCATRATRQYRGTGGVTKYQVLDRYRLPHRYSRLVERDHLIPLELGGADSIENQWPQPWQGRWNATMKDDLENRLRWLVCEAPSGARIPLPVAQEAMRTNWITAYRRYVLALASDAR